MKPFLASFAVCLLALTSCTPPRTQPTSMPTQPTSPPTAAEGLGTTLTQDQATTLGSLELVDGHPLYTMRYVGAYADRSSLEPTFKPVASLDGPGQESCPVTWGCSLFAALADEKDRLYGRNFDWQFSPALLLFTDPPDGYASVSMVDISYLGFDGDRSRHIQDLSLDQRRPLLDAAYLPFDGMNEMGLAVGMAAVSAEKMPYDPQKKTIGELGMIREILDHAGTVEEAIAALGSYNIDMGDVPIHYLVASAAGDSALVEFRQGQMVVFRNDTAWQHATNFLLSSMAGQPAGECPRYDRISQRMDELKGRLSPQDALSLLEDVSQETTQWSIVYHMTTGDLAVVMGRDYTGEPHIFHLPVSLE